MENYRLLSVEYGATTAHSKFGLQERVLMVGKLVCKHASKEHVALREAEPRLKDLECHLPKSLGPSRATPQIVTRMLYANASDPTTKRRVLGKDGAHDDVELSRKAAWELKTNEREVPHHAHERIICCWSLSLASGTGGVL